MKTHYILEIGICLWNRICTDQTNSFLSLTIIGDSINNLVNLVNDIAYKNVSNKAILFLWSKNKFEFSNRMQRIKLLTKFTQSIYEFTPILVSYSKNIYTTLFYTQLPISRNGIEVLTSNQRILIQLNKDQVGIDMLIKDLNVLNADINLNSIKDFLNLQPNAILWKGYEDIDTHAAFQWIGPSEVILRFRDILQNSGISEISSRDQVVELINGS